MEVLLPRFISLNQSGFVKGRNISENLLLAQEIITDIRLRGKPDNVIIKLDMVKAYDRLIGIFTKVMGKMGYNSMVFDMIWRIIANNWYSILINGQEHAFFHSSAGLKQGDALSPALCILTTELLTRALNHLFLEEEYIGYGLPKLSE
ncbi:uncharacterized protein LOC125856038 [Solanum stenotomum]|uniref:uncharacterized protein LOC125856038 n=1 Tax=Solanum stenotomum TaxID=172797 RepID=UPI0020D01B75|nr:uncharacterized protein LOC125856038 [Solanum stenotomum]